jgi:hydrogenase maturation protease
VAETGAPTRVASPLIIGIGNADRGDDGVGLTVARRLTMRRPHGVRVVENSGESMSLLDCLSSAESAYVVDACMTGGPPGKISRFDVAAAALPHVAFGCSTHGMGLAHAVELARTLARLPRRCVVYAIDGRRFEIGAALSPEVATAAERVADLIRSELQCAPPISQ